MSSPWWSKVVLTGHLPEAALMEIADAAVALAATKGFKLEAVRLGDGGYYTTGEGVLVGGGPGGHVRFSFPRAEKGE